MALTSNGGGEVNSPVVDILGGRAVLDQVKETHLVRFRVEVEVEV
jgi:hypothetical protein